MLYNFYSYIIIDSKIKQLKGKMMRAVYSRLIYIEKPQSDQFYEEILRQWKSGSKIHFYSSNRKIIDNIKERIRNSDFNFNIGLVKAEIGEEFNIVNGKNIQVYRKQLEQLDRQSSFNLGQYEVEHSLSRDIILKAGAGTGKTYSMIARINYLIWSKQYTPEQFKKAIVMITFTNEAADSMKEKLKRYFLDYYILTKDITYLEFIDAINDMQISTIDSLARSIVQKYSSYLGLGIDFKITTDYQKRKILHNKLNEFIQNQENSKMLEELLDLPLYKVEDRLNKLVEIMGNKKISLLDIDTRYYVDQEQNEGKTKLIGEVVKKAEEEFEQWSIENNTIALSDLVKKVHTLVNDGTFFKLEDRPQIDTVFIDEFQDTDDVQIELISKFKQILNFDLFVVGDIKQCIYRFRGAEYNAFEQLEEYSGEFKKLGLTKNYRTDQLILKAYDEMFNKWGEKSYLTYNIDKSQLDTIRGTKSINEELEIKSYNYYFNEGKNWQEQQARREEGLKKILPQIIIEAQNNIQATKEKKGTIALLVRYNAEVKKIKEICESIGIVIETPIGGELFKLDPAIDLYKLVVALKNSKNPQYLYNLYSTAYTGVSANKKNIFMTTESADDSTNYFYNNIPIAHWEKYIEALREVPVLKVIKQIIDDTKPWNNYAQMKIDELHIKESQEKEKEYYTQYYRYNLEKILEVLVEYANTDYLSLNKIIQYMKIMITTKQEREARKTFDVAQETRILCTTVHRAKGLEYDTVILPFANVEIEGSMNKGDVDIIYKDHKVGYRIKKGKDYDQIYNKFYQEFKGDEQLDRSREEARILYVALTRVIRRLIYIYGESENYKPRVVGNNKLEWRNMIRGEVECK